MNKKDNLPTSTFIKTLKDAVTPTRANNYAVGFDLTIIKYLKTKGNVEFYDTGIAISPESLRSKDIGKINELFYFEIVPRSSISKTDYSLANNTGIIDPDYRGNLMVALRNHSLTKKRSIVLPCKIVQLIPRIRFSMNLIEANSLDKTERGSGGFGSTDKK